MVPVLALPLLLSTADAGTLRIDLGLIERLAETQGPLASRAALDQEAEHARARLDAVGPPLPPRAEVVAGPCLNGRLTGCVQAAVSFPLPIPGEGRIASLIGSMRHAVADGDARAARWQARLVAASAYLRLLAAHALRVVSERILHVAREILRSIGLRTRAGEAARLDELQASTRVLRRQRDLEAARLFERAAEDELRRDLLLPETILVPQESLGEATEVALRRAAAPPRPEDHPRVGAALARTGLGERRAELVGRQRWPRVSLETSYQRDDQLQQFLVGVSIPLNWLSARPDAELRVARAEAWRAQREAEYVAREAALALASARARLAHALKVRQAAKAEAAQARELLDLVAASYRLGQHDLLRVLAAEEALLEAEREGIAATREVAEDALLVAAGGVP
jgi:outer membrane protein TolC